MRVSVYISFLIFLVIGPSLCFAQEQRTLRDRAAEYFQRYEYSRAAELYSQLSSRSEPRIQDMELAGESYYRMRNFELAESWFARTVQHKDHNLQHLLRYADLLKANGKYKEAKAQYQAYAERSGTPAEVQVQIAGCDSALVWKANPSPFLVQNERGVNTAHSEFSVSVIGDQAFFAGESAVGQKGSEVYAWTGRPYLKLHQSALTSNANASQAGQLGAPSLLGPDLNNLDFHVGPVASPDNGQTLYVTRTYVGKELGAEMVKGHKYRTHRLELYKYVKQDGQWVGTPFEHNNPDQFSVGHAAFSANGQLLYFVSDRPGGQGGTDIWYSERQSNGTWGTPVNAGSRINTKGDELFPQIGPHGELYYSTDGLAGMGGLDVFRAEGSKSNWSVPVNLGYPLNSSWDDFSLLTTVDDDLQQLGFLSSNRPGGQGEDDIYSFRFDKPQPEPEPEPVIVVLQGVVTNKNTAERISDANIVLYEGTRMIVGRETSKGNGQFEFVIEPGKRYQVHGSKASFYPDSASTHSLDIVVSDTLQVALALEPEYSVGKTFVLENLYYDFDKHNIRPDAALVLDELVQIMNENPTMKIELSSHTDSRGNDAYNMALSQRRAKAAVDYLISKGISRDRLVAAGYGETRLINECANGVRCTDEQHQANRRTEVKVLDI